MTRLPTTTEPSTETSIASRPAAAARAGNVMVAAYRNRLDRSGGYSVPPAIRADQAPTEEHRAAMMARLAALHDHLTDGEDPRPGQVAKREIVLALLAAFPTFGVAADGARATANLYVRALADLPTWAVREAAARFLGGETLLPWSGERCPTPPQLAAETRRSPALTEIHSEIAALKDVLGAVPYQPIPDAERKRVLADIAASPSSLLTASRPLRLAAPGDSVGSSSAEIVAPLRTIDVSHLMARLDRKRVPA
ncbi:hypothetical protein [Methylobacterium komagatae]